MQFLIRVEKNSWFSSSYTLTESEVCRQISCVPSVRSRRELGQEEPEPFRPIQRKRWEKMRTECVEVNQTIVKGVFTETRQRQRLSAAYYTEQEKENEQSTYSCPPFFENYEKHLNTFNFSLPHTPHSLITWQTFLFRCYLHFLGEGGAVFTPGSSSVGLTGSTHAGQTLSAGASER